jgi:cyclase
MRPIPLHRLHRPAGNCRGRLSATARKLANARKTLTIFVGMNFVLACAAASGAAAQPDKQETPNSPGKLAEGVYARIVSPDSNAVANAGFVVLDHFVLVFDTHFTPEAGRDLLAQIRSVTGKPVRFVVNSHFHPDHTHGNQAFPGAQEISSTETRRLILEKDLPARNRALSMAESQLQKLRKDIDQIQDAQLRRQTQAQIDSRRALVESLSRQKIVTPILTFDNRMIIRDGKEEVVLLHLGPGHTEGDLIMYLPSEKIAFMGDLFFNAALPSTQEAKLLEWKGTLEKALSLDVEKFVPGHGPVGTRRDVQEFLAYLEALRAQVEEAITRGDTIGREEIEEPATVKSLLCYRLGPVIKAEPLQGVGASVPAWQRRMNRIIRPNDLPQ